MKLITKTQETHRCPYCRKLYVRKPAALKHLKYCKDNPDNRHACFQYCMFLEKETIYETHCDYQGNDHEHVVGVDFKCKKTGKSMWSYIAERRGLLDMNPGIADERMPLVCKFFNESLDL